MSITHGKNVDLTGCSAMVVSLNTCGQTYFFLSSVYSSSHPYYTITLPGEGDTEYKITYDNALQATGSADVSMCGTEQWFWVSWKDRMVRFGFGSHVGELEILRSDGIEVDPITYSGMKTVSHASIIVGKL